MINEFNNIIKLFEEIEPLINTPIKIFIIGGAALMKRGLKTATKDIDCIVDTDKEYELLKQRLNNIKFNSQKVGQEYLNFNLSNIFIREDFRIDLFTKKVCGKFLLSKTMKERSELVFKKNNLQLLICSNEDIFVFKTMTQREGDLEDCINIAKTKINWDHILEEIIFQVTNSKQDVWITWIGERLDLLEEKGLVIPIMKKINIIRNTFFKLSETKLNK